MEKINAAKIKIKELVIRLKAWYLQLDRKKKIILWLYAGCAVVLFIGTGFIILSSVFSAERFDNQAMKADFLDKIDNLNQKYDEINEEYDYETYEDIKKDIEIDYEGYNTELDANKELIENLITPISDPINE